MIIKKKQQIALIVGSGLIGAYLSNLLLKKGFKIIVSSRMLKNYGNYYKKLKIYKRVKFVKLNLVNKKKIKNVISNYKPQSIYYLAGQNSVVESYKNPKGTLLSNYIGVKNYLDILKKNKYAIKFFKANSGYIFNGDKKKITLSSKLIKAESPYTESQIKAFKLIKKYRNQGLKCYSIILFNIVSTLSPISFVGKKICYLAKKIKSKKIKKISVGNIDSIRDFGWAPEMVIPMYLIQYLNPQDVIVGTGKGMSIKKFLFHAFKYYKIDYKDFIKIDKKLIRNNERKMIVCSISKTIKLFKKWKWKPKFAEKKFVYKMCKNL